MNARLVSAIKAGLYPTNNRDIGIAKKIVEYRKEKKIETVFIDVPTGL